MQYALIVDTDSYSGNFERQMCAYITGQIGECGVGDDIAEKALPELGKDAAWFEAHSIHKADEHGCHRPVEIHPTPGFFNDGIGNSYASGANKNTGYNAYVKATEAYHNKYHKLAEMRVQNGEK